MKQIEATILGQSYKLACPPDGETLLQQAVAIVDREMCAIRDAGKMKARERIAVLTALNLAYQRVEQARSGAAAKPAPAAAGTAAAAQSSAPVAAPQAVASPQAIVASPDDAHRIQDLIRRIDQALGEDGLLL